MEPILSLAFAMHSNRGVYAVLLGSGVSRAASIPTGWEVVLDLIRKLAAISGESCEPDPEAWFEQKFGEEPSYSVLLKKLARTQAERQQLLRAYFEPAEADPPGTKQPTVAHRALAGLARSGHVRVIVTTNFDRLMERALEAEGVNPVVISTPGGVDGAIPLTHAACTVLKVHGDYLDTRLKNTPEELAKYDRRIDRLLNRIFDDFGLVVCGWSADWDEALRDSLVRCKSRRFTTYWTARSALSDTAERVARLRSAEVIRIPDADGFFRDLQQKIQSLASFDPPHPLSAKTAVATMKRLLPDDRNRIELHDLVTGEVERVMAATSDERFPVGSWDGEAAFRNRMKQYESIVATLRDLFITGCYWGGPSHHGLFRGCLERLASQRSSGGTVILIRMQRYPALVCFYAGGVAAIANRNYAVLRTLFLGASVRNTDDGLDPRPAVEELYAQALLDQSQGNELLERMRTANSTRRTPFNDYLSDLLREPLRAVLPDDKQYEAAFDRFECMISLVYADRYLTPKDPDPWTPIGRFCWKGGFDGRRLAPVFAAMDRELAEQGAEWGPIRAGLFASVERFGELRNHVAAVASRIAGRF